MANYDNLIASIKGAIKNNNTQAITGQVLQDTLLNMVQSLGKNYAFGGVATPSTNPGTPTTNTFYIATEAGTYTKMGGVVLNASEFAVIAWNGTVWSKHAIFDVLSLPDAEGADPQTLISIVVDGNQLKQVKLASMLSYKEEEVAYGVEWNVTVSATAMTRIGNMSLHRSLPIQKKMKGCLLDDDGNVVEYLPDDDWTGATLDGSKGQVMVEIPMHYRKFETVGDIRRCWVSEYPVTGYDKVPKMYISAYEATLQRSASKLCSVVNINPDYRGGNNTSDWDNTSRSLLGRPATYITRTMFRKYARNRDASSTRWNILDYKAYKAVVWLYCVEYANLNTQLAVNSEKDANGLTVGGLGNGVSTLSSSSWSSFNSSNPFVPCGHTNSFGNHSGEREYEMFNTDGSSFAVVRANRYRGIENPFGHIWKCVDGVIVQISPNESNGGDGTSKVYLSSATASYNDSSLDGYALKGLLARSEGYIKSIIFGNEGEIIPSAVGGNSTGYFADYLITSTPSALTIRSMSFGGHSNNGLQDGLFCANTHVAPTAPSITLGTRLCFIP